MPEEHLNDGIERAQDLVAARDTADEIVAVLQRVIDNAPKANAAWQLAIERRETVDQMKDSAYAYAESLGIPADLVDRAMQLGSHLRDQHDQLRSDVESAERNKTRAESVWSDADKPWQAAQQALDALGTPSLGMDEIEQSLADIKKAVGAIDPANLERSLIEIAHVAAAGPKPDGPPDDPTTNLRRMVDALVQAADRRTRAADNVKQETEAHSAARKALANFNNSLNQNLIDEAKALADAADLAVGGEPVLSTVPEPGDGNV